MIAVLLEDGTNSVCKIYVCVCAQVNTRKKRREYLIKSTCIENVIMQKIYHKAESYKTCLFLEVEG